MNFLISQENENLRSHRKANESVLKANPNLRHLLPYDIDSVGNLEDFSARDHRRGKLKRGNLTSNVFSSKRFNLGDLDMGDTRSNEHIQDSRQDIESKRLKRVNFHERERDSNPFGIDER